MRRLIWPVLFLFLLTLQGAASVFYTGWLKADLPLLAIYCYALLHGETLGALAGFGCGLLQDALTTGIFGFHLLTRCGVGYLVGLMKEKVFKENMTYHVFAIGICCLFVRLLLLVIELIRSGGQWRLLPNFLWATAGYCVGNMLLIVPMLYLVKKVYDWIVAEDISY